MEDNSLIAQLPETQSNERCPIIFVGGMPRSGSTLLMNILAQNPAHFCTPTSGVCSSFEHLLLNWTNVVHYKTETYDVVRPKLRRGIRGFLREYHGENIDAGKIIFEKSRGWPRYIEQLDGIFGTKVYCILCVRDVRCVVSSFEKLYRQPELEHRYPLVAEQFALQASLEGRVRMLMADDGVVGSALAATLDAIRRLGQERPPRIIKVSYQKLTHQPKSTLEQLHKILGLPPYDYALDDIQQLTHEDDLTFLGEDLHTIKGPKIIPQKKDWSVLTEAIVADLDTHQCALINKMDPAMGTTEKAEEQTGEQAAEATKATAAG